jgi:hypothetical protein
VLQAQDGHEVHELARLLETGEEALFLGPLVVLLDEPPDDPRRRGKNPRRKVLPCAETSKRFLVAI